MKLDYADRLFYYILWVMHLRGSGRGLWGHIRSRKREEGGFFHIMDVIVLSLNSLHVLSYSTRYLRTNIAKRSSFFDIVLVLKFPTERRYNHIITRFQCTSKGEKKLNNRPELGASKIRHKRMKKFSFSCRDFSCTNFRTCQSKNMV